MAQIGTFTRGEDGSYTGTIKTLSINIKVRFVPAQPSQNEKAPDLRAPAGDVEIGEAWKRTSKENTVYHLVKLDDPPSRRRSTPTSPRSKAATRWSGRADPTRARRPRRRKRRGSPRLELCGCYGGP